eukprot:363074-Chlamydomonas_euryale.AAC.3
MCSHALQPVQYRTKGFTNAFVEGGRVKQNSDAETADLNVYRAGGVDKMAKGSSFVEGVLRGPTNVHI